MVAVERTSRYANLSCAICHEQLKPGDLVLPSFRKGERRVIHAHVCKHARSHGPDSSDPQVPITAVA